MISESGYWKAKKEIGMLQSKYAQQASKAGYTYHGKKLWGCSDAMKQCLKILEENVELKEDETTSK